MSTKTKARLYDVHVRLTQEEKALLLSAAKSEQRTLANYLRFHGLLTATRLHGPTEIKTTKEQST